MKNVEKNISWKTAPFLRLLIPLTVGIWAENYFPDQLNHHVIQTSLSLLLLMMSYFIPFSKYFSLSWVSGIAIQLVFFSFGTMLVYVHRDISIEQTTCFRKDLPNCLLLELLNDPVPKQKSLKCVARIKWLLQNKTYYTENEKLLVYISNQAETKPLVKGTYIMFRKILRPIENMGSGFDYKTYCRLRHIYAQVYLNKNEFILIPRQPENSIPDMLETLRKKILIVIKKQIPSKSENGLLEALMVGYTDDLDPELLKSYADAGVIHIIAISGLHLALICHMLQLVFVRTGRSGMGSWIKISIIIAVLWGYSLLSGASPSVIRSALMFSMTLFGRNILREAVIYNILASSAFLLLCFDPGWIRDTGFQLSYAAVLGLCLFSKPVSGLFPVKNKILMACRDAASVSIAAQILTTPISIFYFHRFPSYFLIANWVAVPLSSVILIGGILLSVFSGIPPAAHVLGTLLGFGIRLLNDFIHQVSRLPGSVISPLNLSLPQLILSYGMIYCLYRFLKRGRHEA